MNGQERLTVKQQVHGKVQKQRNAHNSRVWLEQVTEDTPSRNHVHDEHGDTKRKRNQENDEHGDTKHNRNQGHDEHGDTKHKRNQVHDEHGDTKHKRRQ